MAGWPYTTARWKRLRLSQLRQHPLCEGCKAAGRGPVRANTVDHRKPISEGGDPFPPVGEGLASYCPSCHSAKTARGSEAGAIRTDRPLQPRKGCDANGRPTDPAHPWNLQQATGQVKTSKVTHLNTGADRQTQLVTNGNRRHG